MNVITVVSGGMDSTTMLYQLAAGGEHELAVISFDYGQRHGARELACARASTKRLGLRHEVVDLTGLRPLLGGSALTDETVSVPEGHYAEASMRATVVPNRNTIMLSVAIGWAVSRGAESVWTAVHAGDHFIYPDCRPDFIYWLNHLARIANAGFLADDFTVQAPFLYSTKADIADIGDKLGVPWTDTWSCYEGGAIHCGACGTCVERREAFVHAGVKDPTEYAATPEFSAP